MVFQFIDLLKSKNIMETTGFGTFSSRQRWSSHSWITKLKENPTIPRPAENWVSRPKRQNCKKRMVLYGFWAPKVISHWKTQCLRRFWSPRTQKRNKKYFERSPPTFKCTWNINTYTLWVHTFAYIHTYLRTYVHTCIRTYVHMYIRIYVHTYIRTYIHTYIRTYMHT